MKSDPPLTDPVWLGIEEIEEVHELALEEFGGPPGVVDPEGLESRVQRPRFLAR